MDEIRLITLLPPLDANPTSDLAGNKAFDKIRCRLDHFSLNDGFLSAGNTSTDHISITASVPDFSSDRKYSWGDYVTLSYSWGPAEPVREILVNDLPFPVTENLYAALDALRAHPLVRNGSKLWVDAICIRQQDLLEREYEVKRMRHIYQNAKDVVAWLGPEDESSNSVLDLVNSLSGLWREGHEAALEKTLVQELKLRGDQVWQALSDFMNRRYWNRLWVIQELAMGNSSTPMLCGSRIATWEDLHNTLFYLNMVTPDPVSRIVDQALSDAGWSLLDLETHRVYLQGNRIHDMYQYQQLHSNGMKPDTIRLLRFGRFKDATDSRDKVYGLLGLMDQTIAAKVKPDYHASVSKVYIDFAKLVINDSCGLEIFSECSYVPGANINNIPSWVPDWSYTKARYITASLEPKYAAGGEGGNAVEFSISQALGTLVCKGIKIDTIDGLSRCYGHSSISKVYGADLPSDIAVPARQTQNAYGSKIALQEAIWRTAVGNRDLQNNSGSPAPAEYDLLLDATQTLRNKPASSAGVLARYEEFLGMNAEFLLAGKPLAHYFGKNALTEPKEIRVMNEALTRMDRFMLTRRLVVTEKGLIGATYPFAERGDVIFVFEGCGNPILMRPMGQRFMLVGQIYVHGIMYGEAWNGLEDGRYEMQDLIIC